MIAKIARAMTFSPGASVNTAQVDDEWTIRNASYELRVAPVSENPDMLMFQSEDPEFVFPSGRYALVLKSQAFDFTVAGPITEPTQSLSEPKQRMARFIQESKALTDPTLAHPARTPRLKSAPKTSQPIKLGDGTELDRLADAGVLHLPCWGISGSQFLKMRNRMTDEGR